QRQAPDSVPAEVPDRFPQTGRAGIRIGASGRGRRRPGAGCSTGGDSMSAETFAARAAVIDEGTRRSLFHMLRTMFPHRNVPDGPYERTVDALLADAAASPRLTGLLAQGARDL